MHKKRGILVHITTHMHKKRGIIVHVKPICTGIDDSPREKKVGIKFLK